MLNNNFKKVKKERKKEIFASTHAQKQKESIMCLFYFLGHSKKKSASEISTFSGPHFCLTEGESFQRKNKIRADIIT
jgi:hypothetical protein